MENAQRLAHVSGFQPWQPLPFCRPCLRRLRLPRIPGSGGAAKLHRFPAAGGRVPESGRSRPGPKPNAPDPDFPDTNGNGVLDDAVEIDPGLVDFAGVGAEQDALAEYLAHFYSETPCDAAETPPVEDLRIQNLSIPGKRDTVFEEEGA